MSHEIIIIRRNQFIGDETAATNTKADFTGPTYEYSMPIPHGSTPQEVGEMVRKAYRRLNQGDDD